MVSDLIPIDFAHRLEVLVTKRQPLIHTQQRNNNNNETQPKHGVTLETLRDRCGYPFYVVCHHRVELCCCCWANFFSTFCWEKLVLRSDGKETKQGDSTEEKKLIEYVQPRGWKEKVSRVVSQSKGRGNPLRRGPPFNLFRGKKFIFLASALRFDNVRNSPGAL